MTVEQSAMGATESAQDSTQAKTFTQEDLNAIVARTKAQLEKKYESKYSDLGDPDFLRDLVSKHKTAEQEQALKRGEFDKIMADLASKKDAEIAKRDEIIREFKIEQPLLNLAAKYRSVNPEQVKSLLKTGLRLNEEGEVEVIDTKTGQAKYNTKGKPYDVESYVKEFLDANPHFVSAAPATTNTQGNVSKNVQTNFDLSALDMTRADHRKIYAEARMKGLV